MNQKKLTQIQTILQEMVAEHFVSGVTCMVIQNGEKQCYYEAGYRDMENKLPMTKDTIFRLYSMSKPVTATAVMMLLEEGKLDLLDPVCQYLPGFMNQHIFENGKMIPAARPVTIQDLLNMTSGLVYPGENNIAEVRTGVLMEEIIKTLTSDHPLATVEIMNRLGEIPLAFHPGERWQYGMSADVLGAVVEVVSGMRFGEFLAQRIFEPLGMKDTAFYVPQEKQNRLAKVYEENNGKLQEYHTPHLGIQNRMEIAPAFESGGAGLVSTIEDYASFTQMLLNKGSYAGQELISPKTVEFMTGAHLTPSQQPYVWQWENLPGYTYANLLRIMVDPGAAVSFSSQGEYGWDGWLGPYMTNDPAHHLTLLMMQQKTNSGTTVYTRKIRNILYSALD
ncbi:MAG: beta-lactamase family protein [Clostridium sp.]|nr:beta-lactamase family protein [Lachnoclostridium sp.]MCM1252748.1 beta-lactamase family protein [Clostridium sp.]